MLFYLILAFIFIIIVVVQGSFFSFFFVGQALPDILLVIIIIVGFLLKEKRGAIVGLGGGLLQDILFGHAIGFFALAKMLLGFGAGLVGREVYREHIIGPLVLVFGGTILHELLIFALMYHFVGEVSFELVMFRRFTLMALYNSLLTLFLFPFFYWFFQKGNILSIKER